MLKYFIGNDDCKVTNTGYVIVVCCGTIRLLNSNFEEIACEDDFDMPIDIIDRVEIHMEGYSYSYNYYIYPKTYDKYWHTFVQFPAKKLNGELLRSHFENQYNQNQETFYYQKQKEWLCKIPHNNIMILSQQNLIKIMLFKEYMIISDLWLLICDTMLDTIRFDLSNYTRVNTLYDYDDFIKQHQHT